MKEKIKMVAIKLFEEKGFSNTSMREIAEELNVSKAALYYHYNSKEKIFQVIIDDSFTMMNDFMDDLPNRAESVWDILRIWINYNVEINSRYPQIRRLLYFVIIGRYNKQINIDIKPYLIRQLEIFDKIIQRGIDKGDIRPDINPAIMIKFIYSAVNGILDEHEEIKLFPISNYSTEELTQYIFSMIKGGIQYNA